jgi:2-C-methyl-D-erythritol 4-phosphate cytidylyltransferase
MTIWAVVPAAGAGARMGGTGPKQLLEVHGRPLLAWTVDALLACERIAGCMLALSAAAEAALPQGLRENARVRCCAGGDTRADSVARGIAALEAAPDDWVLVHDAARPCLPLPALERLVDRVLERGVGALLAQPLSDTLKRGDGVGRVLETVPREGLWRAQTPQMFRLGELAAALAHARAAGITVTDEASAMEGAGHPVQLVEGPPCNLKVTYPDDLAIAANWLGQHAQAPFRAGSP